jgi:hypothetical protein
MFGLCESTKLHRREALRLMLEGHILLIKITIKYVAQAYGEEVSHDFSHHQVQPSSRMPPRIRSRSRSNNCASVAERSRRPSTSASAATSAENSNTAQCTQLKTLVGTGKPILMFNGFDGSQEEMLHVCGFAALEHDFNVLTFEGPGQLSVVRKQDLGSRHDWEQVVTPVVKTIAKLLRALTHHDWD